MAVEKFLQFSIYYKYPLHEWHDSEKNEIYITMNFIQISFKWRLERCSRYHKCLSNRLVHGDFDRDLKNLH